MFHSDRQFFDHFPCLFFFSRQDFFCIPAAFSISPAFLLQELQCLFITLARDQLVNGTVREQGYFQGTDSCDRIGILFTHVVPPFPNIPDI